MTIFDNTFERYRSPEAKPIATYGEFLEYSYSNSWNQLPDIAEFLVAKALEKNKPINRAGWTLYDIAYHGMRIEVKETSYVHVWDDELRFDTPRVFNIGKAYTKYKVKSGKPERQNDLYVFCVNTDETRDPYGPLNLECWDFYVVRTSVINKRFGNQKTVSLGRIKALIKDGLGTKCCFEELKAAIDGSFTREEWNQFAENRFRNITAKRIKDKMFQDVWESTEYPLEEQLIDSCPDHMLLNLVSYTKYGDGGFCFEYENKKKEIRITLDYCYSNVTFDAGHLTYDEEDDDKLDSDSLYIGDDEIKQKRLYARFWNVISKCN